MVVAADNAAASPQERGGDMRVHDDSALIGATDHPELTMQQLELISRNKQQSIGGLRRGGVGGCSNEAYLPPHTASEAETTRHSSRLRHPEAMAVAPKAMDLLHRHPHCLPASWCGKFDGCYHSALSHRICRRWADAVERSSTAQLNQRKNKQQSTEEFLESRALVLVLWEP